MSLPLFNTRSAFNLPDDGEAVELRAFTHGLMPRTVPTMMQHFADDWQRLGADAWNEVPNHWRPESGERVGWWMLPDYLGDHFIAPLIGADAGTCIIQPNVHWAMQCLLSCKELFKECREVVFSEGVFPSVSYSAQQWAGLQDFDIRLVPLTQEEGLVDREALLHQISDDTALVVLSHVGFLSGERLEDDFIREVALKAHQHGALLAVDGYHYVGSGPVNVADLDVDIYVGGLVKEGCGSSGNGFIYVRPGVELTPRLTGWAGDETPFAFQETPHPHPEVRRRFIGGTPAVASLYHSVEGIRILLEAGLDNVWAHSQRLVDNVLERAQALGIPIASPIDESHRGTMVVLDLPHAGQMCAFLKSKNIYTDSRQDRYLRLAPFVWNTQEEVARAFHAIEEVWTSGKYEAYETLVSAGPVT